jgi:hypothetical protein
MVASVQDCADGSHKNLELHSESWIGARNLDEEHVKILHSLFKCLQCCTNYHTFPSCPLLKNRVIKKKVLSDSLQDNSPSCAVRSAVMGNEDMCQDNTPLSLSGELETIQEDSYEDDYDSNVEFDLLPDASDNQDNDFSGAVYPYPVFKVPLGSVKSVSSSLKGTSNTSFMDGSFDVIMSFLLIKAKQHA